jgi:hypothetical protein
MTVMLYRHRNGKQAAGERPALLTLDQQHWMSPASPNILTPLREQTLTLKAKSYLTREAADAGFSMNMRCY